MVWKRLGLAALFAVGAFGQTQLELEGRIKLRMELQGKAVPPREQLLRRERISVKGQLLRLEAGDQFLIQDAAKGTLVLANRADKSYVRTTPERFMEVLANYNRVLRGNASVVPQLEMLEPAAAPPFEWKGQETAATSCRFRMSVQSPQLKEPMQADSTIHVYSVPLEGDAAKALADSETYRMNKGTADLSAMSGLNVDSAKALEVCTPKGRMAVRSVALMDMKMVAQVEVTAQVEMTFSLDVEQAVDMEPELFTVPAGWTEGPAESLEDRVIRYLKPPAAIQ